MNEKTRAYLYRIALALLALAVVLRVVGPEEIDAITEVVAALLGISSAGLATANTSTK